MKDKISKIHGVATVGERGQVVIPAKLRKLFNIKAGDELIVFAEPDKKLVGFIPAGTVAQFLNEATKILSRLGKGSK